VSFEEGSQSCGVIAELLLIWPSGDASGSSDLRETLALKKIPDSNAMHQNTRKVAGHLHILIPSLYH
jgi:hypothetical protein